jgi:hypothetical protein
LTILLLLTKGSEASSAEKDSALSLMEEKEIPLVCFKQYSNTKTVFKVEDFLCISEDNSRNFEQAKNVKFDN